MNRRDFVFSITPLTLLPLSSLLTACGGDSGSTATDTTTASTTTLSIPPLVTPDGSNTIRLSANEGLTEFYDGVSSVTKGFVDTGNSAGTRYLGPTIRVTSTNPNASAAGTEMVDKGTQTGADVNFEITNNTSLPISTHWHGLHVDGFVDGGPYNAITAGGSTWSPTLPIYQQAGTNWYHTHIHGTTAAEVYKGLAGMFIVDDANSTALDAAGLPSTYGVDDIPLIVQDKNFINNVMQDPDDLGQRFEGDVFLVNGTVAPNVEVEAGLNRFRILNASNARFYDFSISQNSVTGSFQVIATEGGFLPAPVTTTSLRMGPGERNEIVIDFSTYSIGDVVNLVSPDNETTTGLASPFTIMTFTVVAQTAQTASNTVPATLNASFAADRTALLAKNVDAFVTINLRGGQNPFESARSTTGSPTAAAFTFNMASANFVSTSTQTTAGFTEEWTITGNRHPFHLHGCHAMIKSIDGDTNIPAELQGWKDVFEVNNGGVVVFMVQFNERAFAAGSNAGPGAGTDFMYMMHCHILGHEDAGMMGAFEVI